MTSFFTHCLASRPNIRPALSEGWHPFHAFRFVASGKHKGKVVLKIRDEEPSGVVSPKKLVIKAIPRTALNPSKAYIVVGGLGGFGLQLSYWLVGRGARKLVLTSRSGPKDAFQHMYINRMQSTGAQVVISSADASTIEGAMEVVLEALGLGTVDGIFNSAMVLRDGFIDKQTAQSFESVCAPKVNATNNLDEISRQLCPHLEYFVVFSYLSSGRGIAGQSNYGFANSSMERVCDLRRRDGLHGLTIQWGAIGDVAESMGGNGVVIAGSVPQRMPTCLSTFDRFLQLGDSVCSSYVKAVGQCDTTGAKKQDLVMSIANIMGIRDHLSLNPSTTLADMGLDSLMAVEVRQMLEREYGINQSIQELRGLSVGELMTMSGQSF